MTTEYSTTDDNGRYYRKKQKLKRASFKKALGIISRDDRKTPRKILASLKKLAMEEAARGVDMEFDRIIKSVCVLDMDDMDSKNFDAYHMGEILEEIAIRIFHSGGDEAEKFASEVFWSGKIRNRGCVL